ncbi:MAG: S49 family peptidase, partial [Xanthobacteraceae bacterium]
ASNATFLRDAFDKAGIEAQFIARGEYKSAANRFTEHGFTEAHREAVTRMLDSLQEQVWQAIAESRNFDPRVLDTLADRAPLLREDAVESGLVDRIGFRDEAYDRIAELVGVEDVSDDNAPPRLYVSRYAGAARSRLAPPVPSVPGRLPRDPQDIGLSVPRQSWSGRVLPARLSARLAVPAALTTATHSASHVENPDRDDGRAATWCNDLELGRHGRQRGEPPRIRNTA